MHLRLELLLSISDEVIMRELATIRRITEIRPIEGADAIECAVVDGWDVVVRKGDFNIGELVIFCEIDSWIPNVIAPFLTAKDHFPKEYNGIPGQRLKTVKLCGQRSQGLILPLDKVDGSYYIDYGYEVIEGEDVSDFLGIIKWERPLPAQLAGVTKGNFPTEVPKTDQERCQNLVKKIQEWAFHGVEFEVTEKLDGSSCTLYLDLDGNFNVCSRNISLKETDTNTFWKIARHYDVESKMNFYGYTGIAIQGELIGEGIQENKYKIKGHEFHVFDIYDVNDGIYLPAAIRDSVCRELGLLHTPIIYPKKMTPYSTYDLLRMAEGKSALNPQTEREGLVWKSLDGKISFKAISNKFLLEGGD
jgi:RNA ligase (TIGR02306 family)